MYHTITLTFKLYFKQISKFPRFKKKNEYSLTNFFLYQLIKNLLNYQYNLYHQ